MTTDGGIAGKGVIFTIKKDGTGFRILHSFSGRGDEGSRPHGALVMHADTLYGVTRSGGRNDNGVLFSLKPDGKRFIVLRRFADPLSLNAAGDGIEPYGTLAIGDNALYGLTRRGGKGGGILFRYELPTP
jgi:uncharacterized repeat protein (TIGR03803 family)